MYEKMRPKLPLDWGMMCCIGDDGMTIEEVSGEVYAAVEVLCRETYVCQSQCPNRRHPTIHETNT